MAFNAFLQINSPTVAGEATQTNFTGWIEIYSFSWGASNPTTVSSGQAGLSAGKVSISSFNVMKNADVSSRLFVRRLLPPASTMAGLW